MIRDFENGAIVGASEVLDKDAYIELDYKTMAWNSVNGCCINSTKPISGRIDCKEMHDRILTGLSHLTPRGSLAIISVGEDPASKIYMKGKLADAEKCGVEAKLYSYPEDVSQNELEMKIAKLNWDPTVAGIIVQLPLPKHLDADTLVSSVAPIKDIDGFVPNTHFSPCTPEGIIFVLNETIRRVEGRNILVIGRGKLVGKPLAKMLTDLNATVTLCHSFTEDIENYISDSKYSAIVTGIGEPILDMSNAKCSVICDAGIYRDADGKIHGDCYNIPSGIRYTPVPGGIGLMTRAMLMTHMFGDV